MDQKKNYKIIGIGDILVETMENPKADSVFAKYQDVIEEIWQKTQREKHEKLFNGDLLNFVGVEKQGHTIKVTAHFTQYKNFFAQRSRPDLPLSIAVVGVSGLTMLQENATGYVVFAKRARQVTDYPGYFELVPSGHIERGDVDAKGRVDFESALVSEFVEETGLSRQCITEIAGFVFVWDIHHNVYDVCCRIVLQAKKESMAKTLAGSGEYCQPTFVSVKDLSKFMRGNADSIVPTSLAIIDAWRQTIPKPVFSYE